MDVVPVVSSLNDGPGAVGDFMFYGAPSLVAQVDLSGWLRAGVFLFHHELGCDEATTVECIRGVWPWSLRDPAIVTKLLLWRSVAPVVCPMKSHLLVGSSF